MVQFKLYSPAGQLSSTPALPDLHSVTVAGNLEGVQVTVTPEGRSLLPLNSPHQAGRSAMTCHFRCADACAKPVPNRTDNAYFGDIVSRRGFLKASGVAAAAVAAIPVMAGTAAAEPRQLGTPPGPRGALDFTAIGPQRADKDALVVPQEFTWRPIVSWGDPLLPDAPDFDFEKQTAAAQAGQFGYNNDYTALIPLHGDGHALLVCNNEYTDDYLMFRGFTDYSAQTKEQLRISQLAHGMSVVEVRRDGRGKPWHYVPGAPLNRRITAQTPIRFTGAAAGSALLRTSADPTGTVVRGTFANCSGGTTPWGTVLSGEENFHGYFLSPTAPADQQAAYDRYGITESEGHGWEAIDKRFDTAKEPNEVNRFGWVVELDPMDPTSMPRKHTALGRMRHEGATVTVARDGRVVVYLGDDEAFDYVYKFVSSKNMATGRSAGARRHNLTLLEEGDLYVARFDGDGTSDGVYDGSGEWIPLVKDGKSMVPGFTVAKVLTWTRLAADKVGPTKMDRPEDVETNPVNGRVYMVCTNNTERVPSQVDESNPRADNKHGHIIEITPRAGDHTSTRFTWDIVLLAGSPGNPRTYFAGFDKSQVSPISCPDNIAFDNEGNMWIATDGNALGACDGLYVMPLSGPERGHLRQFLSVPSGAETCGPVITWDERTVLVAVQHPGELDEASPAQPASLFPYLGDKQPRPGIVQVYRKA